MKKNHIPRPAGMILCLVLLISAVVPFIGLAQSEPPEILLTLEGTAPGKGAFVCRGKTLEYRHVDGRTPTGVTVNGFPWPDVKEPFRLNFTPDFVKTSLIKKEGKSAVELVNHPDSFEIAITPSSSDSSARFLVRLNVKNQGNYRRIAQKPRPTADGGMDAAPSVPRTARPVADLDQQLRKAQESRAQMESLLKTLAGTDGVPKEQLEVVSRRLDSLDQEIERLRAQRDAQTAQNVRNTSTPADAPKTVPAASTASKPASSAPVVVTPEQQAVAAELNRQGFRLLQTLADEKETENRFISPYSIDSAFGMVYTGAKGRTADEIRRVLGMPADPASSDAFFHAMAGQYQAADKIDVLVSNSVWIDKSTTDLVRPEYFKTIESFYDGAFYVDDFKQGGVVADRINALVDKNTRGMIKDIVAPADVQDQHAVLLNTLFFEAKWQYPFKEDQTRPMMFRLFGGGAKQVRMMYQKRRFQYYASEADNVHAVVLPYEDPRFELVALMPIDPGSDQGQAAMKSILASIGDKLDSWLTNPSRYETRVWLPKVDLTDSMQLQDTLKSLGMTSAFHYSTADFSGMFDYSQLKNDLVRFYIGKVIHKTALKMDEYSTKAAAATAIIGAFGGSTRPPPENTFRADRPFLVLIRDNRTGLILFMGRINDPEKK